MIAAAAAGRLLLGQEDRTFRPSRGSRLHRLDVGRADPEIVMDMIGKDRAAEQGAQSVRKQKIGNSHKLISGGKVARDLHAELAKVLYGTPNFRTRCAQLLSNTLSADDHGRIIAEQAHDTAKTRVGGGGGASVDAVWGDRRDEEIMGERNAEFIVLTILFYDSIGLSPPFRVRDNQNLNLTV